MTNWPKDPKDPIPEEQKRPEDENQPEEKERRKCMVCRRRHSGPTPICPGGPY